MSMSPVTSLVREDLRRCAVLRRLGFGLLLLPCLVPRNQAHQIVTVRAVAAEVFVVEEPFNAAVETNLVGVV